MGYCEVTVCFEELQQYRNHTEKQLSAFYVVLFCHNIQFPLANFAKMCENLLISELLDVIELAYYANVEKSQIRYILTHPTIHPPHTPPTYPIPLTPQLSPLTTLFLVPGPDWYRTQLKLESIYC